MKTNEFIKELEGLGFKCKFCDDEYHILYVYNKDNNMMVAAIDVTKMLSVHTMFTAFLNLEETKKQQLFKLLTEYASTPIESREEEKKYAYRFKNKVRGVCLNRGRNLLSYSESGDKWYLSDGCNLLKTKFTHSWLKKRGVDVEQLQEVYEEIEVTE